MYLIYYFLFVGKRPEFAWKALQISERWCNNMKDINASELYRRKSYAFFN